MSDCGVCVGSEDCDDQPEFWSMRSVKGKKEHKCCECRLLIEKGALHTVTSGKFDGEFFSERTCSLCSEIATKFTCGAVNLGDFWQEMRDYGFQQMTTGCLDGLSSPAKTFLLGRWREWKGLSQEVGR